MEKINLLLITLLMSAFSAFSQAPKISVSPESFTENIKVDSTKTLLLTISNSGDRDLNWEFIPKSVDFEKENGGDYTLEVNQDRISDNVWITRANYKGIFNIAQEYQFYHDISPIGTEWYYGLTRNADPASDYSDWNNTIGGDMTLETDTVSMHLIEEDRFFDVVYQSWVSGQEGGGGGFSYTRIERFKWLDTNIDNGSIAPGASANINIELDGTGLFAGTYEGVLIISSDDPTAEEVEIPVTINVSGISEISLNTSLLDYGNKEIGGDYAMPIEISNFGSDTLKISDLSFKDSYFSVTESTISIAPGKKYELNASFSPTEITDYTDTLVITSNDDINTQIEVILQGSGIKSPNVSTDITTINETLVTGTTSTHTIIISNSGDTTLDYRIKLYTDPINFRKDDYADYTLPENYDKITPSVAFARKDYEGLFNIFIDNSYPGDGPTGTQWAEGYSIDLTPGDYTSSMTDISSPPYLLDRQLSVYLEDEDLYIDFMLTDWTSNGQGGGFAYTREGAVYWIDREYKTDTLRNGYKDTLDITFDATGMIEGEYAADILIISNDPDQPTLAIPTTLTVTGIPEISVQPSVSFGNTYTNETKTISVEVENTGSAVLNITSLSNDSSFYTIGDYSTSINSGETGTINVTLSPDGQGEKRDTLYINTNDPNNSLMKVELIGSGILPPDITINKASLSDTIESGSSSTQQITILNNGATDLDWDINYLISDAVSFVKESGAIASKAENQDRISDNIWLTRVNSDGLFNINTEEEFSWDFSPEGTEWGFDKTVNLTSVDYDVWNTSNDEPMNYFDTPISLHLIDENRFFDVTFIDWDEGYTGGGFAYTRVEIPNWLSVASSTGTITASGNTTLTFNIDGSNLNAGVYHTDIHVYSNDADNNDMVIPLTLKVTGIPEISVETPIAFGTVEIGNDKDEKVTISNTGTDTLNISNITNQLDVFTVETTTLSINPGESVELGINFAPATDQLYEDTLIISSNDSTDPAIKVALSGTGIQPPVIGVDITKIDTVLFSGDNAIYQLTIENSGVADLNWTINGQLVNFEKTSYADWTLEENQDRITDNVWITRKDIKAIYNIAQENGYEAGSPAGTQWSFGNTIELSETDYEDWIDAVNSDPKSMIDQPMSLYIPDYKMYFDLIFNSYAGGNTGGGFSYMRNEILPNWLEFSSTSGTITAGSSAIVTVTLNSTNVSGDNLANFSVFSNDPSNEQLPVNVSLYVAPILVKNEIADVRLNEGFSTHVIDITNVFEDADGDVLTIQPISDDQNIVTASITDNELTITEVNVGKALISLRADDGNGNVEYTSFNFIVNEGPTVANPISDVIQNEGFVTYDIDLSSVFTDANGDAYTLGVTYKDDTKVTASISGNTLTITEVAIGSSEVYISADDSYATEATIDTFTFRVNAIPTIQNAIADIDTLKEGFTSVNVDISAVFADADAADLLSYTAESNDEDVVTVAVDGNSIVITEVGLGQSSISVTASDGVGGTISDDFVVDVTTSISANEEDLNSLSVYPNPTSGNILITVANISDDKVVEIYDITGQLIYNNDIVDYLDVDLSSQPKGIYFVKIRTDKSIIAIKKIVVE